MYTKEDFEKYLHQGELVDVAYESFRDKLYYMGLIDNSSESSGNDALEAAAASARDGVGAPGDTTQKVRADGDKATEKSGNSEDAKMVLKDEAARDEDDGDEDDGDEVDEVDESNVDERLIAVFCARKPDGTSTGLEFTVPFAQIWSIAQLDDRKRATR